MLVQPFTPSTTTPQPVSSQTISPPLDFSRAVPRFIASLEQRGGCFTRSHVGTIFRGPDTAPLLDVGVTLQDNQFEQRALLVYQEEQRRAWHQAISQPAGAWNISILDETEISRCFDRIYHAERVRIDHDFDLKRVSTSILSFVPRRFCI
ncbi:uncharacterized protein HD556DRAFT_1061647 [Suillus plorans]|uniref:Uncharacterized protein n=1 Tax=Suillus plorans TaxID=116603 RepID=A0A9P7ABZ3_9AGAM|nr:uncharacterized protein HD556DRAFT_1061647 [Suillus plorans]KAG1786327.1 hypothetical protein HD556DRAFT_1061647 [Suillus plorans]